MRPFFYLLLFLFLSSCSLSNRTDSTRDPGWAKAIAGTSLNNLFKVNDSIYRSEQPGLDAIKYFDSLGIKSILNLRAGHSDSNVLSTGNLNYYNVQMRTGRFTDSEIIQALRIVKDAPKPLLVHCKHGSDRTGVVIAMYRIIFENWTKEKATDELVNGSYGFHHIFVNIPAYIKNVDLNKITKGLVKE